MIDHTSIAVHDFKASLEFYDATLKCLGYERTKFLEEYNVAGYGVVGHVESGFWISGGCMTEDKKEQVGSSRGVHFAFVASSPAKVQQWYDTCIRMGATDNGKPGPRSQYHAGYYGAFVIDPNGWRLEACCHTYSKDQE